jgi:hypothetical protein
MMKNLEAFQERTPGGSFALRDILPHHDVALVNWQLVKSDGTATNKGYDSVRPTDSAGNRTLGMSQKGAGCVKTSIGQISAQQFTRADTLVSVK